MKRRHFLRRRARKAGLAPGEIRHFGEQRQYTPRLTHLRYTETEVDERGCESLEQCAILHGGGVTWLNLDGVHDTQLMERVGQQFNLHPLVLEDILTTDQRPKVEDYGDYLFIVLKMLDYSTESRELSVEQVSLILGSDFVISFQERQGDVFGPVRERIRQGRGRIRKLGADYLAYSLIDAVVDQYFVILERMGEHIEELEDQLVYHPRPESLQRLYGLKREMIFLRKSVWPLREVIASLQRRDSPLIGEGVVPYLRDVYDHTVQTMDAVETFRDMLAGGLDLYLSSNSNRLNAIMKVLTIIATLFMPLTFIAGVYGMNFKHMPELEWAWGYPMVMGIMVAVAAGMLVFFRVKKWL
jgi:magnesium transporter